ncbi:c-type cytochrome [Piscinibacter gummiphilus]|uniref:C-type cytochrome n=1 Tax=Piscinibacter gummiphilus TaxID=946333 RepID=A0ABZ0CW27_9BURK|nr:c-type cytochrome [Piscinibacter gummiphilus]WOB07185.1 c-type cytochrome [Piscinibacter gummiphilus]
MKKLLSSIVALAAFTAAGAQAQDVKASPEAGQKKAAMCIGCHNIPGYQASFPEIHKVPMISGQGAKYIASALNAYKKGERKHPTMRSIAGSLTDQDIADLSAFYEQQGKTAPVAADTKALPQPSPEVAKLLQQGNCNSCHGANYSTPIDGTYPKIAGQHADYLLVALKAYKTSNNPNVGRGNAIMAGMAAPFTPAQLKQIAQYLSTLPTDLHTVPQSRFR